MQVDINEDNAGTIEATVTNISKLHDHIMLTVYGEYEEGEQGDGFYYQEKPSSFKIDLAWIEFSDDGKVAMFNKSINHLGIDVISDIEQAIIEHIESD